jgi:endonuclease YncB( thermonuclease family)
MIKNWNPEKLKQNILNQLAQNADEAGQFIVDDARRRLLAQTELPKWRKYRAEMVAKGLAYEVERKGNEIIIRVGVKTSKRSKRHGFFIEMGSIRYPANPWLRPAVFQNAGMIVELLIGKK